MTKNLRIQVSAFKRFEPYSNHLIAVLFTLFLIPFLNKPIFRDEAFTFFSSKQSLSGLIVEVKLTNFPYFLYYLVLHFWGLLANNIVWTRCLSLFSYFGTLLITGKLATKLINVSWAPLATLFVASNPLFIQQAIYARPYSLAAFGSSLLIYTLIKLRDSSKIDLVIFTMLGLLILFLEPFTIFLVALVVTFVLTKQVARDFSYLKFFLLILFLFFCVFLLLTSINQSQGLNWIDSYFHSIPLCINLEGPASSSTGLFPIAGSSLYPIGVLALLCLGLISYLTTRKNKTLRLVKRWDLGVIATWAFLPTVAMVGISLVHPIYITRYITYSVPGLAILMAIACESIYTNFTLIKSKIVKPILFSSVLGAALVWTFITCDIPVAKTYAYNLWAAEKYIASNGGPNAEIILPTISLETAITYYANIDHNTFTYWPQGKNIWSATSLNLDQATFAAASSNVWLVYENSYDDAPIVASLREHGYAQTGTTLIEGVALIHFEKH